MTIVSPRVPSPRPRAVIAARIAGHLLLLGCLLRASIGRPGMRTGRGARRPRSLVRPDRAGATLVAAIDHAGVATGTLGDVVPGERLSGAGAGPLRGAAMTLRVVLPEVAVPPGAGTLLPRDTEEAGALADGDGLLAYLDTLCRVANARGASHWCTPGHNRGRALGEPGLPLVPVVLGGRDA